MFRRSPPLELPGTMLIAYPNISNCSPIRTPASSASSHLCSTDYTLFLSFASIVPSSSTPSYGARTSQTPSNSKFIPITTPFLYTLHSVHPPYALSLNSNLYLAENAAHSLRCFACSLSVRLSPGSVVWPYLIFALHHLYERSSDLR